MYILSITQDDFYYSTKDGEVKGVLTMNSSLIMFDPDVECIENQKEIGEQRLIHFQACIDMQDISRCQVITLPSKMADDFSL